MKEEKQDGKLGLLKHSNCTQHVGVRAAGLTSFITYFHIFYVLTFAFTKPVFYCFKMITALITAQNR